MRSRQGVRGAALVAVACLAAASASACGGGGTKTTSQADYLARAKQLCQKGNQQLKTASDAAVAELAPGQKMTEAQIDDFVRKTVIPTIRDQIKQLRAIPPPKGQKAHVDEIYTALEKGLGDLEKDPKKLTDGSNVFAPADALAKKYGITVCAASG